MKPKDPSSYKRFWKKSMAAGSWLFTGRTKKISSEGEAADAVFQIQRLACLKLRVVSSQLWAQMPAWGRHRSFNCGLTHQTTYGKY